jgi:hypothetical protein
MRFYELLEMAALRIGFRLKACNVLILAASLIVSWPLLAAQIEPEFFHFDRMLISTAAEPEPSLGVGKGCAEMLLDSEIGKLGRKGGTQVGSGVSHSLAVSQCARMSGLSLSQMETQAISSPGTEEGARDAKAASDNGNSVIADGIHFNGTRAGFYSAIILGFLGGVGLALLIIWTGVKCAELRLKSLIG